MEFERKYLLIVAAGLCIAIYWYSDKLKDEQSTEWLKTMTNFGGILFGINTLVNIIK